MSRSRLTIAGLTAGVVFAAGFTVLLLVPGLGGTSTTKDFTDFYTSDRRRGAATLLGFVLMVGVWLMVWLFTELRARLDGSTLANLAHRFGIVGVAAVMIGTTVDLGPTMVQNNNDNAGFVGIPVAHAFTQAGAGAVVMGLMTCAAAMFLYGLDLRRSPHFPRWLGVSSLLLAVLLLVGSFFIAPGYLLTIWAIVVAIASRRGVHEATGPRGAVAAGPLATGADPVGADSAGR
jgi:hypothetical protein